MLIETTPLPLIPPTAMSNDDSFLRLENISKSFGGVQALNRVSFALKPGHIYHLMGENGSGKSTLIKIISGAQAPDSGTIYVREQAYSSLSALESIRIGIETVYQDLSLFQNLSVAENVALNAQLVKHGGRLNHLLNHSALKTIARPALERVGLPSNPAFLETRVERLPIAIRQLVAIARGIATQASLVIMDEPTTALTQREVENLIEIVARLKSEGVSVLFVSHKLEEVFRIGGDVIVMRDGRKVIEGPLIKFNQETLGFHMTGKRLAGERYRSHTFSEESLLEVRNLSLKGRFHQISFRLRKGEVLGITGLLDSGRNDLARALAGVRPADHGTLMLEGETVHIRSPRDAIRHGIGYVPEDRLTEGLFSKRSIRDNIVVSILDKLLRPKSKRLDSHKSHAVAEKFVGSLNVATPNVSLPVQALSGGNQQRVLIARWLAIEPRLLVLHGPTVGVDVGSKDALYRVIQRLAQQGLGIIIISDDLPELIQNCDSILVLKKGVLAGDFVATGLTESELSSALMSESSPEESLRESNGKSI